MRLTAFHNSQLLEYRQPFGAIESGEKVTVRLYVETDCEITVNLRLWFDQKQQIVPMAKVGDFFEATIMPEEPLLMWYYFLIYTPEGEYFYGNNKEGLGGEGELSRTQPPSFQITVYKKGFKTPDWFKNAVMYQIFVDRFYNGNKDGYVLKKRDDYIIHEDWNEPVFYNTDSNSNIVNNDFYGGNLLGIIKRLDYLESLGVTVLYLSPIFEAWSNHKYDTGDYMKIDAMFGDEETLRDLCAQARKRGISVMLDGVFSHTGSDSRYFNKEGNYESLGAFQSEDSPYRSWYRFGDKHMYGYECWWDVPSLPNVDEMNEKYRDFIINNEDSVVKHWLKCGVRGWRLDVADELPSLFLEELRDAVKETNKNAVIIGEVWEDASNKISYGEQREYFLGEQLDSVMNYPFKDALISFIMGNIDAEHFNRIVMSIYENYPRECMYAVMNLLGSHDVFRIKTLFGEAPHDISVREKRFYKLDAAGEELARKRTKLAALWQMSFMGVPCIYYGDEVGSQGHRDPFNRAPFPWNNVDFELMEWYRRLIKVRRANQHLMTGEYVPVMMQEDVFCYLRRTEGGKDVVGNKAEDAAALVIMNRSKSSSRVVNLDLKQWKAHKLEDLMTGETIVLKKCQFVMEIPPLKGFLFGVHQ